jgi:hypothetical protein
VMLTRAGVGGGRSSQTKGSAGGSTSSWHLKSERRRGAGGRRSVVGSAARPCHLLARSSAPRRSSIRGGTPRMERLPVRHLGAPACPGQGSLNLKDPFGGSAPVLARRGEQRHPRRDPMVFPASGTPWTSDRLQVQFGPLTREGDVQGDVGLTIDDGPDAVRDWSMPPAEPDRHLPRKTPCSRAEGDVQGDVGRSCCVRISLPDGVERRTRSAAGTAS